MDASSVPSITPLSQMLNDIMGVLRATPRQDAGNIPPTNRISPPEKQRLILQQIIWLLRGHKCSKQDSVVIDGPHQLCHLANCRQMRTILTHLTTCEQVRTCTVQHCAPLRQIISHWIHCVSNDCATCKNLKTNKNTSDAESANATNVEVLPNLAVNDINDAINALSIDDQIVVDPMSVALPGQGSVSIPVENTKKWHATVTPEMRKDSVCSLLQVASPTFTSSAVLDEYSRHSVAMAAAQALEISFFNQANSHAEYYHLVAQEISKIKAELDEKLQQQ